MARKVDKLTDITIQKAIKKASRPKLYDGGGLFLQVATKSWFYRYQVKGCEHMMALGPYPAVSLAKARILASEHRAERFNGVDPLEARKAERKSDEAKPITFDHARDQYIASHKAEWRNEIHRQQWENTLATYVTPVFGNKPVQSVSREHVLEVLQPLWLTKTETASRLRGRIERILDYARVQGWREGENPARWRGHLDQILPKPSKVRTVEHHAALPYTKMVDFVIKLRKHGTTAALALEFVILTAARSSEARGARWPEIDGDLWTVPRERMKGHKEHRVPLSDAAKAVLDKARENARGDLVFAGYEADKRISDAAIVKLLARMGYGDFTIHGFRSTFKDWAHEMTNFPTEAIEMALAHAVGDKVEQAYRRGDMYDKRVKLMQAWADYCDGTAADNVLPFGKVS